MICHDVWTNIGLVDEEEGFDRSVEVFVPCTAGIHQQPWRKALLYNLSVLYTTGVGEAAVKLMHHYTSVFEHVGGVSEVEAKIEAFSDHAGFPQLNGQRRPWRWRRWRQRQRWWR